MSNLHIKTRIAADTKEDVDAVLDLTNDAFMADAFFKKEAYHLRFDLATVKSMINDLNSRFIIATHSVNGEEVPCGSIFFHWTTSILGDLVEVTCCYNVPLL